MKKIDIRNLANIGVGDVDVYNTNTKKFIDGNTQLLIFLRSDSSDSQSEGFPKIDKTKTYSYNSQTIFGISEDKKYNKSFGFDLFNENLLGNSTDVIIDSAGNKKTNFETLEKFYDKNTLSLQLKDKREKPYYINNEFKLKRGDSSLKDKTYYAPNLLIIPNKQITLYAKYFDTNDIETTVFFKSSSNKGIESFTPSIIAKNEKTTAFIIKTKSNETIDENTTIIAFIKDNENKELEIGRLTLLPNMVFSPKLVFVDVFYNKNTLTSTNNYADLIRDINQNSFNQAGINFKAGNNRVLNVISSDTNSTLSLSTYTYIKSLKPLSSYIKQNNGKFESYEISELLQALKYLFFENLSKDILQDLENEFRNLEIKVDGASKKLLPADKTIKDLFDLGISLFNYKFRNEDAGNLVTVSVTYDVLFAFLYNYLSHTKLNFFPIFYCDNVNVIENPIKKITSNAVGTLDGKGLIIPSNSKGMIMTISHELGHNFGLGHTFENHDSEFLNIKLNIAQTLENIMDYLPEREIKAKTFLSFQWDIMRNNCQNLLDSLDFQIIAINKPDDIEMAAGWGYVKENTKTINGDLKQFSTYLLQILIKAFAKQNNYAETKVYAQNDIILKKIADVFVRKLVF